MAIETAAGAGAATAGTRVRTDPAYQAFLLLRTGFTLAPILFGLDKFAGVMADWTTYLAPGIDRLVPGSTHSAMLAPIESPAGTTSSGSCR